jgi:SAM-dependent methyltransferase
MTESFSPDWLGLREPFDAAARNPELAVRLAQALPARPRILDLGAGTGSLLRWLGHFIGRAQAWTLVDADPRMATEAFGALADAADDAGWPVTWPGRRTLLMHSPRGAWRVEALVADLAQAPANLPLHGVDAVVNTALCDLVSEGWVHRMAAACAARRLPFYAALNVTGRERFSPPHRADALVARGFARDQRRDKGFGGTALGARAPGVIAEAFAAHGYTAGVRRATGSSAGMMARWQPSWPRAMPARRWRMSGGVPAPLRLDDGPRGPGGAGPPVGPRRPCRHPVPATRNKGLKPCRSSAASRTISPARPTSPPCWCGTACGPFR